MTAPRSGASALLLAVLLASCGPPPGGDSGAPVGEPHAHSGVACAACHEGADPSTMAVSTAIAVSQSADCEACHAREDLSPLVSWGTVEFPHAGHAGPDDELGAACGACHTHRDGPDALTVSEASCYLCHAELTAVAPSPGMAPQAIEARIPEESCLTCHGKPAHVARLASGVVISHGEVVTRGISCTLCHYDVTAGTGEVIPGACHDCHGVLPGLALDPDTGLGALTIHATHAVDRELAACARCHTSVRHDVEAVASSLNPDCRSCHGPESDVVREGVPAEPDAHRAVQQMFAGVFPGLDAPARPSAKFVARVGCNSCHGEGSASLDTEAAVAERCAGCHGNGFGPLVHDWAAAFAERVPRVGDEITRAERDGRLAGGAEHVAAARAAWTAVHKGLGVHNPGGAHELLLLARRELGAAYRAAGVAMPSGAPLGPSPAAETCARCHYGHELREPAPGGFAHAPHVLGAGVACSECHSDGGVTDLIEWAHDKHHGAVTVSDADCRSCHHAAGPSADCARCHADFGAGRRPLSLDVRVSAVSAGGAAPAVEFRTRDADWSHGDHRDIACAVCHAGDRFPAVTDGVRSCTDCHDSHHRAGASCASCHTVSTLKEAHSAATHRACDSCHDAATVARLTPDRSMCVMCHAPQASGHYEDTARECADCHFQSSPAGFRPHLSGGTRP